MTFALHPDDYEQPRKFIQKILALGAKRFDANNAPLMNSASNGEPAAQITDIFHARSFHKLES